MHLFVIGYRGVGKSVVSMLLGQRLGRPVFCVDQEIQKTTGCSIAKIFETLGESGFRDLESQQIQTVCRFTTPHVVDLGGGAVIRNSNREILKKSGALVWLRAQPETIWARMQADPRNDQQRPNLTEKGGLEEVREILAQRETIYAALSALSIETDKIRPEQVAEQIVNWIRETDNT